MSFPELDGWVYDPIAGETDTALVEVFRELQTADPQGDRTAQMMRSTLDQLYDGQRTGRYSWAQLHKTERTHFGTLFEINLRREFDDVIAEGDKLDFRIAGHDVDCKFSQRLGGWMIPPEAFDELLVVGFADDTAGEFALGVVRASDLHRRTAANRDAKVQLNPAGRSAVRWLQRPGTLPPNVLLSCSEQDISAIFDQSLSGQKRLNELFRRVTAQRIGRNTIATVAQQNDFMRRVRENGGARTDLRPEGYIILGGDYALHRRIAVQLGLPTPLPGEVVSARIAPTTESHPFHTSLEGTLWAVVDDDSEVTNPAPVVPYH